MKIAVGSDHRGFAVKENLVQLLHRLGHEVVDCGTNDASSVDYPDIAAVVAHKVSAAEVDRGILICGTGIGMCIAANKFPGVRAAPCHDDLSAEMSRRHNDLNLLCLSADMLGEKLIDRMVEIGLRTEFEGGRHAAPRGKDRSAGSAAGTRPCGLDVFGIEGCRAARRCHDPVDVVHASAPRAAAGTLQRRPQARVVRQTGIRRKVISRRSSRQFQSRGRAGIEALITSVLRRERDDRLGIPALAWPGCRAAVRSGGTNRPCLPN